MGYDRGLWEEGLLPCTQTQLKCLHGWSVHNLLWQFVPVRDYSNAERILRTTGFTPLLVNPESLTAKPKARGGSRNCVACKIEKSVPHFLHTGHPGFFLGLGKRAAATVELLHIGRGANFWTLSSAWQSRVRMGEDACIAYSRCGRMNALNRGRKTLGVRVTKDHFFQKKHPTAFFNSTDNVN